MGTPFLGEIRIASFGFPPKGWALCNGQLLPINQNQALFSILGTTYGGDGRTTFALPNLQGRAPASFGQGAGLGLYNLGQFGGEETHTLTVNEWPSHSHTLNGTGVNADAAAPAGALPANTDAVSIYGGGSPNAAMAPAAIASANAAPQPHENMQPYLTVNFIIALQGIFPSQN